MKNNKFINKVLLKNFFTNDNKQAIVNAIITRYKVKKCHTCLDIVKSRTSDKLNSDITSFLDRYKEYIDRAVNAKRCFFGEECSDCKQFIYITLFGLYHKQYQYTNLDKVVKSIIKRKIIDFSKKRNNDLKGLTYYNQMISYFDNEDIDLEGNGIVKMPDVEIHQFECIADTFTDTISFLKKDIVKNPRFDKWDRDFLDHMVSCTDDGIYDISKIIGKLQGSKEQNSLRFQIFTGKIKKYYKIGNFL